MKYYKSIVIIIISLIIGGGLGYTVGQSRQKETRLEEIYSLINQYYFEVDEENTQPIEDALANGLLLGLQDQYAAFFTKEENEAYQNELNNQYVGVGATIVGSDLGTIIYSVFESGPAKKAGLGEGDIIIAVDGKSTLSKSTNEVVASIMGEEGTSVEITYIKNGETITTSVVRQRIDSSCEYKILEEDGEKIGYLAINSFGSVTPDIVERGLKEFKDNDIETIAIDLRGNSGGDLSATISIMDMLIQPERVVVSVESKEETEQHSTTNREKYNFEKGYIFTNGESASASEVLCAGLSEQLDYTIIGTRTFGKGIVQALFDLADESSVKFTTGRWLTSNGVAIHGIGIAPDIEVVEEKLSAMYDYNLEEFESYSYGQIDTNIGYLQTMLNTLGYLTEDEISYFGNQTRNALVQFELDNQLNQNGVYEKEDYQILLSRYNYIKVQIAPDLIYQKMLELIK